MTVSFLTTPRFWLTVRSLQGQLEVKDRQIEQQAQTITRLTDALAHWWAVLEEDDG